MQKIYSETCFTAGIGMVLRSNFLFLRLLKVAGVISMLFYVTTFCYACHCWLGYLKALEHGNRSSNL